LVSRNLAENPELGKAVMVLFLTMCTTSTTGTVSAILDASWRLIIGTYTEAVGGEWEAWKLRRLVKESVAWGKTRTHNYSKDEPVMAESRGLRPPNVTVRRPGFVITLRLLNG